MDAYENKIYCKGAPMKTAVIWNKDYIDTQRLMNTGGEPYHGCDRLL